MEDVLTVASFPRLYAAASLKQDLWKRWCATYPSGFPRLYAAASLKQRLVDSWWKDVNGFSAALCRGLIEAFRRCGHE